MIPFYERNQSDLDFIKAIEDKDIKACALMVRNKFMGEGSGHDWWHIYRVWRLCLNLLDQETKTDLLERKIAQISALLHDIADHKFHDGDLEIGPNQAFEWCKKCVDWPDSNSMRVAEIVRHISFKGAKVANSMSDPIGKIVQDADRLDALGAIGIARTFAYGGNKKQPLFDPSIKPILHENFKEYYSTRTSTIHHFYEKLLLLEQQMHTQSARKIAHHRTKLMEQYLDSFFKEWYGD